MLDNGYGISLDSVLMRPPHVLVNVLCLVLVELDIVLCMSTLLAEATVLLENPRSFASVVCVCVCVWLQADYNVSGRRANYNFLFLDLKLSSRMIRFL